MRWRSMLGVLGWQHIVKMVGGSAPPVLMIFTTRAWGSDRQGRQAGQRASQAGVNRRPPKGWGPCHKGMGYLVIGAT